MLLPEQPYAWKLEGIILLWGETYVINVIKIQNWRKEMC